MRFEVDVGGRVRQVVATPAGDGFAVTVDGKPFHVDAVRVDDYTLSLLVDRVHSREVVITPEAASPAGSPLTVRVGAAPLAVILNGRRRRIVRYTGFALSMTAALLAAAVVASLMVDLGPAARRAAEERGSKYMQRPLHIGSLSIHLLTGKVLVEHLMIEGVHPGDRPFFT